MFSYRSGAEFLLKHLMRKEYIDMALSWFLNNKEELDRQEGWSKEIQYQRPEGRNRLGAQERKDMKLKEDQNMSHIQRTKRGTAGFFQDVRKEVSQLGSDLDS